MSTLRARRLSNRLLATGSVNAARWIARLAWVTPVLLSLGACGRQEPAGTSASKASSDAASTFSALKARYGAALPPGIVERYDSGAGALHPKFAFGVEREPAPANLTLPERASGAFHLEDVGTGAGIDVSLRDTTSAAGRAAGGYVLYDRAHASGATLLHRALPTGTEDYLVFASRPPAEEIAYEVALGRGVSGVRLVSRTLEMLDAAGAPRLRVAAPYVVGADGATIDARLTVDGCKVSTDPAPPWGRPVTPPGATTCTVRVAWSNAGVTYPAIVDPRWTTTGSMATARQDHAAIFLPATGKVLVAGGRTSGTSTTGLATAELFDKTTGTWAATASMSGGRYSHSATLLNASSNATTSSRVLIAGGTNAGSSLNTAQLYNQTAGTWAAAGNLNAARHAHTATLLADGRVLVAGGLNGTATLQTAALYDPASGAGAWTATVGPIPPPGLRAHSATLIVTSNPQLNNKVLLVGGNSGTATSSAVYLFDPAQSAFSTLASLPSPREGHTATVLANGKILVAGGRNGTTTLATAVMFDPSVGPGSWSSAGTMTSAREGHTATLLSSSVVANGLVLVAGGSNGTSSLGSAELFSGTNTWTATTAMPASVQGHTATLLANGAVLVAGGRSGTTTLSAARLYDPSLGIACTTGSQCTSGFCTNGVCCDTACNGGCGACNLPGKVGTCSAVSSGTTCRGAADVCDVAEQCSGSSVTCPADARKPRGTTCPDDGNPCTTDACDGTNVACAHAPGHAGLVCRGAVNGCDVAEVCSGSSANCPADAKVANGTSCDDANACTQGETCQAGVCSGGTAVVCSGADACHTVGACDRSTGCPAPVAKANGTACSDGNACTQTDTCQSGSCVGANPTVCAPSDQCHDAGSCDPTSGACSNPQKPDWTACDDGNSNTDTDACHGGVCSGVDIPQTLADTLGDTPSGSGVGEPAGESPGKAGGEAFAVTDDGEATYNVPIWVPDGRASVQPYLALAYHARNGDSAMGLGWGISGISTISRCHVDNAHDGVTRPIQFDESDRLCLNGERLVLVSGTYNHTGSEYRTEDDQFMKIVQVGSDSLGPTGFLVYLQNGMRESYGSEASPTLAGYHGDPSAVLQGNRATVSFGNGDTHDPTVAYDAPARLSWALASSRDRFDNEVQYFYVTTPQNAANNFTLDFRPSSIQYTVSPALGRAADRNVQFVYNDETSNPRFDVQDSFVSGLPLRVGRLLTAIDVSGPDPTPDDRGRIRTLREYRFGYQNEDGRSPTDPTPQKRILLTSVQECDGKGVCKPATTFDYTQAGSDYDRVDTGVTAPPVDVLDNTLVPADVDGDGLDDLIVSHPDSAGHGPGIGWSVYLSTGRNLQSGPIIFGEGVGNGQANAFLGATARAVDLDLDGKADFIAPMPDSGTPLPARFLLLRSALPAGENGILFPSFDVGTSPEASGDDWGGLAPTIYGGDFTGDGLPDLVRAYGTVANQQNNWAIRVSDQASGRLGPYLGMDFQVSGREFDPVGTSEDWNSFVLDVDGDGKQDMLFRDAIMASGQPMVVGTRMLVFDTLGDVRGTPPNQIMAIPTPPRAVSLLGSERLPGAVRYQFADVNGDGLKDAIEIPINGGNVRISINNGRDFMPPVPTLLAVGQSWDGVPGTHTTPIDPGVRVLDYDLDGRSDVLVMGDGCMDGASGRSGPLPIMYRPGVFGNIVTPTHDSLTSFWNNVPVGDSAFSPSLGQTGQNGVCGKTYLRSQVLDVNGDGLADFVQLENQSVVLYIRRGPKPNLLSHVTDGMGHTTDVGYKPISDSSVYTRAASCDQPAAGAIGNDDPVQYCGRKGLWVVSDHHFDQGTNLELSYDHTYDTARTDMAGVGFLGMDRHTVSDERTGESTEVFYDHRSRLNGVYLFRRRPSTRIDTIPLSSTHQTLKRFAGFQYDSGLNGPSAFATPLLFTYEDVEQEPTGTSAVKRSIVVSTDYDSATGFLRSKTIETGGEINIGSEPTDPEIEQHTYTPYPDQTDTWLVGLVKRETTTYTTPANSNTGAPAETTTRTVQYDRDSTTGAITKVTLEPDSQDANLRLETSYGLDPGGMVRTVTESDLMCAPGDVCPTLGHVRTTTVDYDPTSGIYPYRIVNPLQQTTLLIYHPGLGVLGTIQDVNNLTTTRQYDGFGRLTGEQRADEVSATRVYRADFANGFPLVVDTTARGALETVEYDVRGEEAFVLRRDEHGQFNQVRIDHDPYGRVQKRWRPYPQSQAGQEDSLPHTTYAFDEAGRMTSRTLPPESESWTYLLNTTTHRVDSEKGAVEDDTELDHLGRPMTHVEKLAATATAPAHDVTTHYGFGPFGVPRDVVDTNGNVTHMDYDVRGRRRQLVDPDIGTQIDVFDAFGEYTSATDAAQNTATVHYDPLGRPVRQESSDGVTTFTWDTAENGIGQLAEAVSHDGVKVVFEYNARKRRSGETWTIGSDNFRMDFGFDDFGRRSSIRYPLVNGSRYEADFNYTDLSGELLNVTDATQAILWQVDQRNPERNILQETAADGFVTVRGYEPERGLLTSRTVSLPQGGGVGTLHLEELTFHYDMRGYLDARTEVPLVGSIDEHFEHDELGRLKTWRGNGWTGTYDYDDIGNMRTRELTSPSAHELVTFTPGDTAGPHAVTGMTSDGTTVSYGYDSMGRQVSGPDRLVSYTSFGLPRTISHDGNDFSFEYDPFQHRSVKQTPSGTTVYIGELYERRRTPAGTTHVMYIPGGHRIVAQVTEPDGGARSLSYFHDDHLGSISALTSSASQNITRMRFDPFGRRLAPDSLASSPTTTPPPVPSVTRGFTGHEHDDDLGLINMNGRIYDPVLARFLTPDPQVTRPLKSQSFNRYSYVENSPLRFIDPTGFEDEGGDDEGGGGEGGGDDGGDPGAGGGEPGGPAIGGPTGESPDIGTPDDEQGRGPGPGASRGGPPGMLAFNDPHPSGGVLHGGPGSSNDGPSPGADDPSDTPNGPNPTPNAPPGAPAPGPSGPGPGTTDDGAPSPGGIGEQGSSVGPGNGYGGPGIGHDPGMGIGGPPGSGHGGPGGPGGGGGEGHGVGLVGLAEDIEKAGEVADKGEPALGLLGRILERAGSGAAEGFKTAGEFSGKLGSGLGILTGTLKFAEGLRTDNSALKLSGAVGIGVAIGGLILGGPLGLYGLLFGAIVSAILLGGSE